MPRATYRESGSRSCSRLRTSSTDDSWMRRPAQPIADAQDRSRSPIPTTARWQPRHRQATQRRRRPIHDARRLGRQLLRQSLPPLGYPACKLDQLAQIHQFAGADRKFNYESSSGLALCSRAGRRRRNRRRRGRAPGVYYKLGKGPQAGRQRRLLPVKTADDGTFEVDRRRRQGLLSGRRSRQGLLPAGGR